jgi:predicted PurR-regulated permease PerM
MLKGAYMKKLLASLILVSVHVFFVHGALADSLDGQTSTGELRKEINTQTPYITMNIGVEIAGLEKAVKEAAEGLNLIGESLQNLADNPELTPEHNKQIKQTLTRIDELGQSLTLVVEQFPATVEKSMAPVVKASNELSSQIKRIVISTSIALILIILTTLAAVYYFILAPGTRSVIKTANLLDELANTLKATAEIVEISSERNLQVMEEVQKVRRQSKKT